MHVVVTDSTKQKVNRIAYELSSPNETVTPSDVLREAINDYLEKFEVDRENCVPRDRGRIESLPFEVEEVEQ